MADTRLQSRIMLPSQRKSTQLHNTLGFSKQLVPFSCIFRLTFKKKVMIHIFSFLNYPLVTWKRIGR